VRRAELTDAALHIIATHGIAALSTRSLAEHVGLSTGAIFRHFASLDALLLSVVERVEAVLASTYPPSDLPPRERLERFVEARSTTVGNQVGILRLMLSEQFVLALPEGGAERLGACVRATRAFLLSCIREGQASGVFRSDIDAPSLAMIVMGTIQVLAVSTTNPHFRASEAKAVRSGVASLLAPPKTTDREEKSI